MTPLSNRSPSVGPSTSGRRPTTRSMPSTSRLADRADCGRSAGRSGWRRRITEAGSSSDLTTGMPTAWMPFPAKRCGVLPPTPRSGSCCRMAGSSRRSPAAPEWWCGRRRPVLQPRISANRCCPGRIRCCAPSMRRPALLQGRAAMSGVFPAKAISTGRWPRRISCSTARAEIRRPSGIRSAKRPPWATSGPRPADASRSFSRTSTACWPVASPTREKPRFSTRPRGGRVGLRP